MRLPWKSYPTPDATPSTGGKEARERAEDALKEVRHRKAQQSGLRTWFRADALENHYARDITDIISGRNV